MELVQKEHVRDENNFIKVNKVLIDDRVPGVKY